MKRLSTGWLALRPLSKTKISCKRRSSSQSARTSCSSWLLVAFKVSLNRVTRLSRSLINLFLSQWPTSTSRLSCKKLVATHSWLRPNWMLPCSKKWYQGQRLVRSKCFRRTKKSWVLRCSLRWHRMNSVKTMACRKQQHSPATSNQRWDSHA